MKTYVLILSTLNILFKIVLKCVKFLNALNIKTVMFSEIPLFCLNTSNMYKQSSLSFLSFHTFTSSTVLKVAGD